MIVVRPSPKREKKKKKRLADPTRRSYNQILEQSEQRGSRIIDPGNSSTESNISHLPDEEAAVAAALGLPRPSYMANSRSSLSMSSERSSVSHDEPVSPNPGGSAEDLAASAENTESESSSTDEEGGRGRAPQDNNGSSDHVFSLPDRTLNGKESNRGSTDSVTESPRNSKVDIPVIITEDTANEKK